MKSRALVDVTRALADVTRALADVTRALADVTRALADVTRALADVTRALADVTRAPTLFEQSEPRRKDTRLRQTGNRIIAQSKLSAAALARANGTPSYNQTNGVHQLKHLTSHESMPPS